MAQPGRKRTVNLNLPVRMYARVRKSGVYFYYRSGSTEIPLGSDYVTAIQKWGELEGQGATANKTTFRFVAELYFASEAFRKLSPRTQRDYLADIGKLYEFFDHPPAPLDKIEPMHIADYRDWRQVTHSTQELALFSAIWRYAREKGHTRLENPAAGVKRNRGKGRGVYVDDALFSKVYEKADQPTKDAIELAFLAAQRPGDSLRFKETDIRDGFLWVMQSKTRAKLRIEISGKLKEVIDRIMARKDSIGGNVRSLSLVVNEKGRALTASALDGRFGKARELAGVGTMDFQFRDLRAKAATEIDDNSGMEAAQGLLGHTTANMTRHYIRNAAGKIVKPVR